MLSQETLNLCLACHGADGNSSSAGVPSIAAQPKEFTELQLILFREGLRVSEQMNPVTKGMPDREVTRLAQHFAALPAKPAPAGAADAALMKAAREAVQKRRCGVCHLPDFRGQVQIPRLAGQREEYLADQLKAYRDDQRAGSDTSMNEVMYGVTDAEIKALAHFFARSTAPARVR